MALVIGNRPAIPHSLLAPGATLGSAIVNQFAEASPGLGTSAVIALAGILLLLTILVNVAGQLLVRRRGGRRLLGVQGRGRMSVLPPVQVALDGAMPGHGSRRGGPAAARGPRLARRSIRRRRMSQDAPCR